MVTASETLKSLCVCPNGENPHTWYQRTGGNSFRLKVAYVLIDELISRMENGFQYNCLTPSDVRILDSKRPTLSIAPPKYVWPSEELPIEYVDPLIMSGQAYGSQSSVAFSCAVIVFQMLTICHPYHGEDYETDSALEQKKRLSAGEYEYIGLPNGINRNDLYEWENTQSHMSTEMSALMQRMFAAGKCDPSVRPTLFALRTAVINSLRNTLFCNEKAGHPDYDATRHSICPHCGKKHIPPKLFRSWYDVSSDKPIIMPDTLIGSLKPTASQRIPINHMYLREGTNTVSRSMLDPFFSEGKDAVFLRIEIASFSVTVVNHTSASIMVEENTIPPLKQKQLSIRDCFHISYDLASMLSQRTALQDQVYGAIQCNGYAEIGGFEN